MQARQILEAVRNHTGLGNELLDDHTLQGLDIFIEAVRRDAGLTAEGEKNLSGLLVAALANRLRVENYLQQHPELLAQPVERPMFVFGLPRTGTTITINLLNADPARRCFLRWEAFASVPPPATGFRSDPRFLQTQAQIDQGVAHNPQQAAIHHEDADSPTECQLSLAQTMCSQVLDALVHVPDYHQWLFGTSYLPAFAYHKRLLQLLQAEVKGRWTLKNPWHPLFLDDLIATYPDAQLVMNHRDPVAVMGSACSLIKHVRAGYTDNPDRELIAQMLLETFDEMIRRTLDFKARHGWESIYDLPYGPLMKDPSAEMKKLYAHFDEPFSLEAQTAMEDFLRRNPKGKHGSHEYSLAEFGLTASQVRHHFRDYCEQFNITG